MALAVPALALVVTAGLFACADPGDTAAPAPRWDRIDLWSRPPTVEREPPGGGPAFEPRLGWQGAREVRDLDRLNAGDLRRMPSRPAAQIRVIAQRPNSRLAWTLDIPEGRPYWSLLPFGTRAVPCPCTLRAGVRDANGEVQELYRTPADQEPRFAPATVELDLTPFAGTRVELLLQVEVNPGQRVDPQALPWIEWGSPALYGQPGDEARLAAAPERLNVLVLGLDTFRYDAIGPRADGPSLTPALDRLAAESDVWTHAFSTFNATNPSFASIFTGLYGRDHGVHDLITPLADEYRTMAEVYQQAGYATFAAISASHLGPNVSGLGQGFDRVSVSLDMDSGELIADLGMEWIAEQSARSTSEPQADPGGAGRPWFAWLHFFDSHTPHTPPQPYALGLRPGESSGLGPITGWTLFRQPGPREYIERVLGGHKDLYDGEVAYLDRQLDRVLGYLATHDLLERTVIAVVADHGESLGEHGILYRHGGLHDQTTHVPLIIRWPEPLLDGPDWADRRGRRIGGLVQTIDLFPTLLAATGLEVPPNAGSDLRELTTPPDTDPSAAGQEPATGRRAVFAEHANRRGEMVRTERWKYMLSYDNPALPDGPALFDLEADPLETVNLAGQGLEIEGELAALLERWKADTRLKGAQSQPTELDEEEVQRLRSLGYLQ